MNPYNTLGAAFAAVILAMLFLIYYPKSCQTECFEDMPKINEDIMTCPEPSSIFTNSNGTSACCDGNIYRSQCKGKIVCALSENNEGIELCNKYIKVNSQKEGKNKCPKSMPNYFTTGNPGEIRKEFCTSSKMNTSYTAPIDENPRMCSFMNYDFDIRNTNSCEVQRLYDNCMCPNKPKSCEKKATQLQPNSPVVIQVSYVDREGNPRTCMEDESMRRYYNSIKKELAENNINLCSVSKKVYIDNSMQIANTSI